MNNTTEIKTSDNKTAENEITKHKTTENKNTKYKTTEKTTETKAIEQVNAARAKGRRTGKQYIEALVTDFIELHGDRKFADDPAVVGGVGRIGDLPVTVIALEKGKDTKEKIYRNFGSSNPEGYRKSLRLMRQAEKFNRPIICFVDTAGAFCGIGAEERGQGQAIAENILEMMALKVPIMSILIGEGGSGGALALATADRVWMLEKAIYSVISPEGCASILWKDTKKVADAAECLKLTAQDMFDLGVVERVIPEGGSTGKGGSGKGLTMNKLKEEIGAELKMLLCMEESERLEARYQRFRKFGAEV